MKRKLKIAVGTTSEQKINYLREILSELNIDADIETVSVDSGVSEQPLTSEETKNGSINRAKTAFLSSVISEIDYAIGIECGYCLNPDDKYEILCWATITDKNNKCVSFCSTPFLLPEFCQDALCRGVDLDGYFLEKHHLSIMDEKSKNIAESIRNRKIFITEALRGVLGGYCKRDKGK